MNKTQLARKIKEVSMMGAEQLEEFEASVHMASVNMKSETVAALLNATDARRLELRNTFSLEVETSEIKLGDLS